jgi:hypothetical protein
MFLVCLLALYLIVAVLFGYFAHSYLIEIERLVDVEAQCNCESPPFHLHRHQIHNVSNVHTMVSGTGDRDLLAIEARSSSLPTPYWLDKAERRSSKLIGR